MGGSSKGEQTIGYKYFLGVDFKWCHAPIDAFRKLYVDNRIAWQGSKQTGDITIDNPELFGEFEGGVSGTLNVLDGNPTQLQNPYLVSQLGAGVPAYRGVTSTVLNQMYLGNNPYLKGWTAEISRIHRRLMNGTAIVQWQDDYSAVPPFSETEDGYSSLVAYYGSTVEPQQILIQIDLSSYSNGFQNNFVSLPGQGQDIIAVKAAVTSFLIFLRDQATWAAGSLDIAVAYFRGTTGTPASENTGGFNPNSVLAGAYPNVPRRGMLTKVGATTADIETLIQYVSDLTVFPDTTTLTDTAVGENATEFFGAVTAGTKYRVNYTFSALETTQSATATTLNTSLNGGLATKVPGKYFFGPSDYVRTPVANRGPQNYLYGYTTLTQISAPTGWVELPVCAGALVSGFYGVVYQNAASIGDVETSCGIPSGYSDAVSPETPIPANTNAVILVTQAQSGFYIGRWFPYRAFFRSSGSEEFSYQIAKPDDTLTDLPRDVPLQTSPSVINNPNTSSILNGVYLNNLGSAGLDMNPAHILRECLTDQQWGLGVPEAEIDEASFYAAAVTLYNERFGLSFNWNRQTEVEEFIKVVLNHIDAVLYVRRETGKWFLKLIRNDYDINTIPNFTDADVISWDQVTRKSEAELVNSVTVKFNSRSLRGPASLTVNNLAQIQQLGAIVPATVNYPGCWQQGLASVIAQRDLRSLSSATISGSIKTTRKASTLYPGDVFRLTSARYGLTGEVMRVVEINLGDGRSNAIFIKFVQDVFALDAIAITGGATSEWSEVLNEALPVTHRVVEEEGYRNFVRRNGEQLASELYTFEPDLGYLTAYGEAPTPDSLNARIKFDDGSGYLSGGIANFCPTATLATSVTKDPTVTTWTISNGVNLLAVYVNTLAKIGNEYVRVDSIDLNTNTLVVGRGCLDTIPEEHVSGSKIFFFERPLSVSSKQFVASDVVDVKLLTNAGYGQLPALLAPTDTITFNSRINRPYPVGNLKINDAYEGVYQGTLSLTWKHRDKTLQTSGIPEDYLDDNIGPEAGVTYQLVVELYDVNGAFVSTLVNINVGSVNSYSLNTATYPATTTGYVKVMIKSVKGGVYNLVSSYVNLYTPIDPATMPLGAWYDPYVSASMFQNADGTGSVTVTDTPVGKMNNLRTNGLSP